MGLRSRIPALNAYGGDGPQQFNELMGRGEIAVPPAIDWMEMDKKAKAEEQQAEPTASEDSQKFDMEKGGESMAKAAAKGGGASDALSAGLLASGNPYAMGAGLGLMTLSSINKQKQEQKQREYDAKVAAVQARRNAIRDLVQIGQSLRA
jgi:hypothetical protein